MLYKDTLNIIRENTNPGIEYEIALFYRLLAIKPEEQKQVLEAIESRQDSQKIKGIISYTNIDEITSKLHEDDHTYSDVSFETQNDEVGPADIVLILDNGDKLGLSVKYNNSCSLNVTGMSFINAQQKDALRKRYIEEFVGEYIKDMSERFGNPANWARKTSEITDRYIDEIRDVVIRNWPNVGDKTSLIKKLFHADSPINFWIVTYKGKGYSVETDPISINSDQAEEISLDKYETSYLGFFLHGRMIGKMQVKFNNGFLEKYLNRKGHPKKKNYDFEYEGIKFLYGDPFGSWNFSFIYD